MKIFLSLSLLCTSLAVNAQKSVLINNVQIFNGKDENTTVGNILIEDNLIKTISSSKIAVDKSATIIDGKGKFAMPGLIDAHSHTMMESMSLQMMQVADMGYINLFAAHAAEKQLLRGFTTVRDLGGASLSLKKAIDQHLTSGPRIYPSGATISQTGGHGDFGLPTDVPRDGSLSYIERGGMTIVADGGDQVLKRTREQLRNGATQIKLMAGGGVASEYDPLDVSQYTEEEFKAAVSAAENWGTYVTVHAYTPKAIQAAIKSGVKCIEHGQLVDEETVKLISEQKIWWCMQPFLDDEDAIPFPEGSANRAKQLEMTKGTDNAYKLAKKYNVKLAWGTDCLFDARLATRQGAQLTKMTKWFSPFEVLKMATSTNAELLALSGRRNPYPQPLGVITEGAYADLIIVDGNPLTNIKLIENPESNFKVIMKDGIVFKNTLND
ncbi:amidohydrolase family protein [Sphingobacterium sp. SG20118]|uniref:metal-dependent hydrolase family protein n=1 Tax=Sphingobacterium sp. SG20118 TaxID=3367156 RepID=UPI0037DFC0A1